MDLPPLSTIRAERARRSLAEFVRQAWPIIEPSTPLVWNWHIDVLCDHIQALIEGRLAKNNLIINVPPGSMKSTILSVCLPAWVWIQDPAKGSDLGPGWRGLFASGDESIAVRDSLKCRDIIDSEWYQTNFRPKWGFTKDQNAKGHYKNTSTGYRRAMSAGAKVTGNRAHCLIGSTLIETEFGQVTIEELVRLPVKPRVWSFNHSTSTLELKMVAGTLITPNRHTVTIRTESGNVLECTPEHQIWAGGEYREAAHIAGLSVSELWWSNEQPQRKADSLPPMLDRDAHLYHLRRDVPEGRSGARQVEAAQCGARSILLSEVHEQQPSSDHAPVRYLRTRLQAGIDHRDAPVLHEGLCCGRSTAADASMRLVQSKLPTQYDSSEVLFDDLQECSAERNGERNGQPALQSGDGARRVGASNEAVDCGARPALPRLRLPNSSCSPHRRGCHEQRPGEPCGRVQGLSQYAPQVRQSPVVSIERGTDQESGAGVTVYDLQVEGNSNFFANGILVHNCLIVDDPNDAQYAYSKPHRDQIILWWDQAFANRLADLRTGKRIIIQQRLHEEDLTGHVLATEPENWEVLIIREEYERPKSSDPDFRPTSLGWSDPRTVEGELFFTERFPADVVSAERKRLGSAGYAGQHQQRPSPAEGQIFKKKTEDGRQCVGNFSMEDILRRLAELDSQGRQVWKYKRVILSADTAFKEKEENDFSVVLAIGERPDGLGWDLLDRWKDKAGYPALKQQVKMLNAKWKPQAFLIEDKASGQSLIQELRLESAIPLVPIKVDTDKVSRAHSVVPTWEAGNVFVDPSLPWVSDFIDNLYGFPKLAHDDDVDAFTQAMNYLHHGFAGQGVVDYYTREAARLKSEAEAR